MNTTRPPLNRALCPENIAVIGASDRPQSRGSFVWRAIAHSPLLKNAWAINPKYKYIGERPCFAKISEVPGNIDLAVISLRADRILKSLIDAGERGVACALITPDENAYASDRIWLEKLILVADQYQMRLIGPDSLGLMNPGLGVNASYWPNLPRPGNIALITQSGMIGTALLDYAQEAELGFSGVISTGAAIDLDMPELLDYYAHDKNTRVIALHIEGIRHPRAFYCALNVACQNKHVVILKANTSSGYIADRIACFKMGTDAGSEKAFAALVERAGATLVSTFEDFTAAVAAFATNKLPQGNRLAVIANGSGFAALTASAAQERDIDLHGLSNPSIKALANAFPSQQIAVNPVNVGATAPAERYRKTLQIVLQDPMIDGAVVVVAPGPVTTIDPTLRLLAKTAAGSYKPVITAWVSDRITRSVRKQLRSVPNAPISAIQSPVSATHAFSYLAREAQRRQERQSAPSSWTPNIGPKELEQARGIIQRVRDQGRHTLSYAEVEELLGHIGIQCVPSQECRTLAEAQEAAEKLGWPVAVKVISRSISRKSDVGGVVLDVANAQALADAWQHLTDNMSRQTPLVSIDGVIIQKMLPHETIREVRLAVTYDNVLGPIIEFGTGGFGAEIYQDLTAELPPLSFNTALRLVNKSRIAKALGRYRGLAPTDQTAFAETMCRISLLVSMVPAIRDMTLNPLLWTQDGVACIDAKVHLNEEALSPDRYFSHLTICPPPIENQYAFVNKGDDLTLRPLLSSDFEKVKAFISRLSDKTSYLRFHTAAHLADERICEMCTVDYARESAWIVMDQHEIRAMARWTLTTTQGTAEFGIVVEDAWHRRGLARLLMNHLEKTALEHGLTQLVGHVLKGNEGMQGLMQHLGFSVLSAETRETDAWVKQLIRSE